MEFEIYNNIMVIAKDEHNFSVISEIDGGRNTIAYNIPDVKTALMIKQAYGDGFYDGRLSVKGDLDFGRDAIKGE